MIKINKCIVVTCTLTVLIGLLIAFYVLLQKSSTVEIDSEWQSDLSKLFDLDSSTNYCRTPSCVIATSKLHVIFYLLFVELNLTFDNPTEKTKFKCKPL